MISKPVLQEFRALTAHSAGGQKKGTNAMKAILGAVLSLLFAGAATAAGVEGHWRGTAMRGGETTKISLTVERSGDALVARYDLPRLGLAGMPLTKFAVDQSGKITTPRAFSGRLDGDRIRGDLYPAQLHGPPATIELSRAGAPQSLPIQERAVQFSSRGNLLKGTFIAPDRDGPHPAMVSLHGSGPSTRWLALDRARRFAQAGYAMLIFDKPGSGESQGDWTMTSLDEMAQDALAAVEFVRVQPGVDPAKVGIWAHSQAGWVASRAAAMPNHIAFAIVLAGGGASSREVEDFGYLGRLRRAGAGPDVTRQAMAWVDRYFDYVRTGTGYDAVAAELKSAEQEEWARALGIGTVYPTPDQQPKWRWVATYDPAADIRTIRFPVLLLFAEKDENTPSSRSLALWRAALPQPAETKLFADAEHHFLTPARTEGWPTLAPGYYETQIDWLDRVVARGRGAGKRG